MSRIGICHFRVGETDGVSLEIAKWQRALRSLGHSVFLCAGRLGEEEAFLIPELSQDHPEVQRIRDNAFVRFADYPSERALWAHIEEVAGRIEGGLRRFVGAFDIDLLIVENIWSLSPHLPATLAVWRVVRELRLPTIAHHHDFYWEKEDYQGPTCGLVRRLLATYYPPHDPHVMHVVLNRLAQGELHRRGLHSVVVPNVLDFDERWEVDEFNHDFRERLGLSPADIVVLQATRVVPRKGIEIAVDLVSALTSPAFREALRQRVRARGGEGPPRPVLLLPNRVEEPAYLEKLRERITEEGVEARFLSDRISFRRHGDGQHKTYSLWDTYLFADLVTYPSLQEGWGNQFLEAVRAKLPVVTFEYPVFRSDIAPLGFRYVSLGHKSWHDEGGLVHVPQETLLAAAQGAAQLLAMPTRYQEVVEHNFTLAKAHFSLPRLREALDKVVQAELSHALTG